MMVTKEMLLLKFVKRFRPFEKNTSKDFNFLRRDKRSKLYVLATIIYMLYFVMAILINKNPCFMKNFIMNEEKVFLKRDKDTVSPLGRIMWIHIPLISISDYREPSNNHILHFFASGLLYCRGFVNKHAK